MILYLDNLSFVISINLNLKQGKYERLNSEVVYIIGKQTESLTYTSARSASLKGF